MRKVLFFLLLIVFCKVKGQTNLVIDGSFEDYHTCPNGGGLTFLNHWFDPTGMSSDYFNACNNGGNNVPNTTAGYQLARTGNGFTGFWGISYPTYGIDAREYIGTKLFRPLKKGNQYQVEFYVNLTNRATLAIDGMGAYFSIDSIPNGIYSLSDSIAQITNPSNNILIDTLGWIKIGGTFYANGGEQFLTIGNFLKLADIKMDSTMPSPNPHAYLVAYYFCDDVSVVCLDCDTDSTSTAIVIPNNLFIPDAFSPNGDGNNDKLFVRGNNIQELYFAVYDRWGEKVFETTDKNIGWDGTYKGSTISGAVFVYYCKGKYTDGKEFKLKGDVTLVR